MATPQARSCNKDLWAGMTDGAYKKGAMNRGGGYCDEQGEIEHATCLFRGQMSGVWHGFHELAEKRLPDTRLVETPYTMTMITAEDMENV